jgi:trehalose 6-phosphate synthase
MLTAEEEEGFYYGFSNEVLWPLFHDLFDKCVFDPDYWRTYQEVNVKYASVTAAISNPDDFIWVHDYHLMLMAGELRQQGVTATIGFFLHIPFPALDIFVKLPWRFEILRGLLQFDLLGFQTLRDRDNFMQCVNALFRDVSSQGTGAVIDLAVNDVSSDSGAPRTLRVGSFPISLDYQAVAEHAASDTVIELADRLREDLDGRQMILGLDRLDYSKGLPNRFEGFRTALRRYPDLQGQVVLSQHMVPSRADIPEYRRLLSEIERLVGEINGEFARPGWVPIHYFYRALSRDELVAYKSIAHMVLITSLKDGMNLVAKEYCAARIDEDGVLILSEFAGAVAEMQNGALLVNPYDYEGIARRIYEAFNMPRPERQRRMRELRQQVRENDIFHWVDMYLRAATDKDVSHFPMIDDYAPQMEAE